MIGFKLEAAKANFLDRKKVTDAVGKAERRNLSKFGAFVRQRVRTSIRKSKGTSSPGGPPHAHLSGPFSLRGSILFAWDGGNRSVVIGPTLFSGSDPNNTPPALLERGGDVVRKKGNKFSRLHYRPRPFMGPAFKKEKANLPAIWNDSVH